MVINFDKQIDPNITDIKVAGQDFEMINLVTGGSMGWSIDIDLNIISFLGTTDVQITFNSASSLELYSKQIELATSTPYNPYTHGLAEDPHYDKIPTGQIQTHTYTDTDIEQDLINNN